MEGENIYITCNKNYTCVGKKNKNLHCKFMRVLANRTEKKEETFNDSTKRFKERKENSSPFFYPL